MNNKEKRFTKYCSYSKENKLLINTLTQKYFWVKEPLLSYVEKWMTGQEVNEQPQFDTFLEENHFLLSEEDESRMIEQYEQKYMEKIEEKPYVFIFCMTYECNLRCFYCFEDGNHGESKTLGIEEIDKALGQIREIIAGKKNAVNIVLEGGEPLLRKNWKSVTYFMERISELILECRLMGRKSELSIFTNGRESLMYLEMLREYRGIIGKMFISLAGPERIHNTYRCYKEDDGNFKEVIKTTAELLKAEIPVMTVVNLDTGNVDSLKEINQIIKEQRWDTLKAYKGCYLSGIKYFSKDSEGRELTDYDIYNKVASICEEKHLARETFNLGDLRMLKNIVTLYGDESEQGCGSVMYCCTANQHHQTIYGPEGLIYVCTKATAQPEFAVAAYGNHDVKLDQEKIDDIWFNRKVTELEKCKNCNMAFICGGMCTYKEEKGLEPGKRRTCRDVERLLWRYLADRKQEKLLYSKDAISEMHTE